MIELPQNRDNRNIGRVIPNRKSVKNAKALNSRAARRGRNKKAGPVSPSGGRGPVSPTGGSGPVSPTAGGSSGTSNTTSSNGTLSPSSPAYSNDTSDAV